MWRLFCISLVALIAASCGGNKQQNNGDTADLSGKKVFRYNMAEGQSSLDPAFARNQANIWASTQLYNGLFELSKELHTVPCLVDSWEITEDGLEYTFKLKKGVFFHDSEAFTDGKGREVKAADFVYSFKRILDPNIASTGAWVFNDKVKRSGDGEVDDDWVTAPEDYTLVVKLERPFAPFLEILTMPYAFVIPQEAVDKYGKDFRIHPVGTGPFKFKSWDEGNSLILLKNENYWRKDESGNQLPYLDAVQVSFINDKNTELLTFQQGKLDFASGILARSADAILKKDGSLKEEYVGKFKVEKVDYMNTEYIGLLLDKDLTPADHPFHNKKFRQALSWAINREEMVSYLLNNVGTPGHSGMIPPAMSAFDDNEVVGYSYDVKKAEELLKEAGYPEGKGLPELKIYTTAQSKPFVEYLQKQWEAIGVKIEIEINQVPTHQELVDNSKVNFFRGSWLGDYPDAENYLALFYSKNFSPAGPNKTHFVNEKFDSLYNAAILETDGFARFDIYLEMDKLIVDEAPVIVLFYDEVIRLIQNNVVGLEPNQMNILNLERVDFTQSEASASLEG